MSLGGENLVVFNHRVYLSASEIWPDYRITGNFCGQLWTAEIKIAEYYVK
jgi:hypothetical protein